MELMIYSPKPDEQLPVISWNYDELEAYARQKAEEYKSIAYTGDDSAAMKKDRADINRFINALEAARKEKKKEYLAPYTAFENQVKKVLEPLREAEARIVKGLNELEEQYRDGRIEVMKACYAKYVCDLADLVPFQKTIREENFKRSVKDKNIDQFYKDLFSRISDDLKILQSAPERFQTQIIARYTENFSLMQARAEWERLEELEQVMEARRRAEESTQSETRDQDGGNQQAAAHPEETAAKPVPSSAETVIQIVSVNFRAYGTREQLLSLGRFMKENGIRFERIEAKEG